MTNLPFTGQFKVNLLYGVKGNYKNPQKIHKKSPPKKKI